MDVHGIIRVDGESLALSIEGVDDVVLVVVKTFVREVLRVTLHFLDEHLALDLHLGMIVNEVVMGEAVIVEELDEDSIIRDERARDKGVREPLNRHGVVVDAECLVDVELLFMNHLRAPCLLSEDSQSKLTVVDECDGIFFTSGVLLNLLEPDETILRAANLFLECLLIGLKIVHANPVFAITRLSHHDGPG